MVARRISAFLAGALIAWVAGGLMALGLGHYERILQHQHAGNLRPLLPSAAA